MRVFACLLTIVLITCAASAGPADEILLQGGMKAGLVVQADCEDAKLLVDLATSDAIVAQGLVRKADQLPAVRDQIRSAGRYGPASARLWSGGRLPYAQNLVNLLIAPTESRPDKAEIHRVLVPGGSAVFLDGDGGVVETFRKPWPEGIDQWSHYLHDASGNAVAQDTLVGPPRRVQWMAGPRWTRAHEKMSGFHAMVTAGGRLFTILDEGQIASMAMPPEWRIVARDAFNGKLLWKRDLGRWWPVMFGFKAGPAFVTRRLVASEKRIYTTLSIEAPLSILDATTGELLHTCRETANVEEIILEGDTVFVSCHDPERTAEKLPTWINKEKKPDVFSLWHPEPRTLRALDAETGKLLWECDHQVNPQTLAADKRRVYFHDGEKIVALNRTNGKVLWKSDPVEFTQTPRSDFRANLVISEGVVLFSGGQKKLPSYDAGVNNMVAFSASDGRQLWEAFHPHSGYESPKDLFVIDGVVWSGATVANRPMPQISPTAGTGVFIGYDLKSGREVVRFEPDVPRQWFHHRCYPAKATSRYFLTSRQGIEFVDIASQHWDVNHWVRGACLYGVMPANGLIYAPPHPCGCRPVAKLNGFWALAPAGDAAAETSTEAFEKGPAWGLKGQAPEKGSHDWPMYRGDIQRSSSTPAEFAKEPEIRWRAKIGGKLSAPVVSGGRIFVSRLDDHTMRCIDARNGRELWAFTADAQVDTPPTVCGPLALFGCADGWLYAVSVQDGVPAWRRKIAPADRSVLIEGRLESAWPVHGSVLVRDNTAWCLAGRSIFLDGGMHLVRVDIADGSLIDRTVLEAEEMVREIEKRNIRLDLSMWGARADILVGDEQSVFLKTMRIDKDARPDYLSHSDRDAERRRQQGRPDHAHLFAPQGFLDDTWHHRSYTVFGNWYAHGSGGFYQAARSQPAGRLLAFDDDRVYGFGKRAKYFGWTTAIEYRLFSTNRRPDVEPLDEHPGYQIKTTFKTHWAQEVPLHVKGLVKAGDRLVLAGTSDPIDEGPRKQYGNIDVSPEQSAEARAHWLGKRGGWLWVVSARDGHALSKLALPAGPAWDALAVAGKMAVVSLSNGELLCLSPPEADN